MNNAQFYVGVFVPAFIALMGFTGTFWLAWGIRDDVRDIRSNIAEGIKQIRIDIGEDIREIRIDIRGIRDDVTDLRERVSRIEERLDIRLVKP